jgi:hypothetical protein
MIIKNVLPVDVVNFLTHHLLRMGQEHKLYNINHEDSQVPNSISIEHHSPILDSVNEIVWPHIESILGEELIPTYSYSRVYQNGNELKVHRDRNSCEVSVSIQLGRSHHYSWPIFVENKRYDLAEGDGVLYYGNDQFHWRNTCEGPEGYYSAQLFLHYVKANGKYTKHAGDNRWPNEIPFKRNRTILMDMK